MRARRDSRTARIGLARHRRRITVLVVAGMLASATVAISNTGATAGGPPPFGAPINQWTDAQIVAQLAEWAPGIAQMQADGSLLEGVPADQVATVNDMASKIATPSGRQQLAASIRSSESDPTITALAAADDDPVADGSSNDPSLGDGEQLSGDTSPKVKVAPIPNGGGGGSAGGSTIGSGGTAGGATGGGTTGGGRGEGRGGGPDGAPPHPVCPNIGTLADGDAAPMAFLTPRHDTFIGTGPDWPLYSGERQILTGTDGNKYLKVVVNMQDTKKGFPVGALNVRVWVKKNIGDHAGTAYAARSAVPGAPAGAGVYCYPSSSATGSRGYAVLMIPMTADLVDPGFQLYAELIEWDPWFQLGSNNPQIALLPTGPQYWAGGEQVMLHVGNVPQLTRAALLPAVGAFVDKGLVVDDDSNPTNDMEGTIESLLKTTIGNKMAAFQTEDVVGQWAYDNLTPAAFTETEWDGEAQASFSWDSANPPNGWDWLGFVFGGLLATLIDVLATLKITKVERGAPESLGISWVGLGQGDSDSALKVNAHFNDTKMEGKLRFFSPFNCRGSLQLDATAGFRGWIEEGSPTTGLRTHGDGSFTDMSIHDWSMPWYNWIRPSCVIGWGIARLIAKGITMKAASSAVVKLLNGSAGEPGVLEKLINGFNVPALVSGLSIPGGTSASFAGWRDSCALPTCPTDESFLQPLGLDVMADGNLGAPGSPWGAPWPAVYVPNTTTDVASLVRSHASTNGLRDLGVIANADLINSLLHDIAGGGLLNLSVPGGEVKPSIAPVYQGALTSPTEAFRFVVPDLRAKVEGIPVALSLRLGANATIDAASGVVDPTVTATPEIEALGCQVDYLNFYGLSYGLCGHANNGNFGLPTLPQIINQLAEAVVNPIIDQTLGDIKIPTPGAVAPGVQLSFYTLEVQNRGGHIGLYADRTAVDPGASIFIWTPAPYFTWTAEPSNFPGSGPLFITWTVTDLESGQQFGTAHCTNQLTCNVPGWMFQQGHPPNTENPKWKRGEATVTISRAGITKSESKILTWIL